MSTMAFYVAVHSDACKDFFPKNRSGNFKNFLNMQIDLNEEYMVAISSVSRYYETAFNDIVFVREKRAVKATQVEVQTDWPVLDAATIQRVNDSFDAYIKASPKIVAYSEAAHSAFSMTLTYNMKTENFKIYPNLITEATLKGTRYKTAPISYSKEFEGIKFTLKDMDTVGTLVVEPAVPWTAQAVPGDPAPSGGGGAKGVPIESQFAVKFSNEATIYLKMVQHEFHGKVALNSPKQEIELRAQSTQPMVWENLRATLPYYWGFTNTGRKFGDDGFKPSHRMFEKQPSDRTLTSAELKYNYYLREPFSGNAKCTTLIQSKLYAYPWLYKISSDVAKILKVPEVLIS